MTNVKRSVNEREKQTTRIKVFEKNIKIWVILFIIIMTDVVGISQMYKSQYATVDGRIWVYYL